MKGNPMPTPAEFFLCCLMLSAAAWLTALAMGWLTSEEHHPE
jgi:hypothetical protein